MMELRGENRRGAGTETKVADEIWIINWGCQETYRALVCEAGDVIKKLMGYFFFFTN